MKLSKKYIEFLDVNFDKLESWSDCVRALVNTFGITSDYAEKVIDAYIAL